MCGWPERAFWAGVSTGYCDISVKAGPTPMPGRERLKYRTRPIVEAAQEPASCQTSTEISVKTRAGLAMGPMTDNEVVTIHAHD